MNKPLLSNGKRRTGTGRIYYLPDHLGYEDLCMKYKSLSIHMHRNSIEHMVNITNYESRIRSV